MPFGGWLVGWVGRSLMVYVRWLSTFLYFDSSAGVRTNQYDPSAALMTLLVGADEPTGG